MYTQFFVIEMPILMVEEFVDRKSDNYDNSYIKHRYY